MYPLYFGQGFKVDKAALKDCWRLMPGRGDTPVQREATNKQIESLNALARPHSSLIEGMPIDLLYTGTPPMMWSTHYEPFKPRIEVRDERSNELIHTVTPDEGQPTIKAGLGERLLSWATNGKHKPFEVAGRLPETSEEFFARAFQEAVEAYQEKDRFEKL